MSSEKTSLLDRAARVHQDFHIGGRRIFPNAYLAPMSGVTDISFRRLISRLAGGRTGMLISEFISVEGLTRDNPKSMKQLAFAEEERPFSLQIFGGEAERMAWGATIAEEAGSDFVEINCGCPAPKVVSKGGGSGLLKDLPNLALILRSVKAAVSVPVTIKVRIGWNDDLITLFETLKIAEGEGASAFVIHGRTRAQGYRGLANWELIGEAKARAKIPVVGNGDVLRAEDILQRLETYRVDGVAVGRGAMHNPWIFAQIADLYEGKIPRQPGREDYLWLFREYETLLRGEVDLDMRVLGKLKQMTARVLKGLRGASAARLSLLRSQTVAEFFDLLIAYFDSLETVESRLDELTDLNGKAATEVIFGNAFRN